VADAMHDDGSAHKFPPAVQSVAGEELQAPDPHGSGQTGRRKRIVVIVGLGVAVALISVSVAVITSLAQNGHSSDSRVGSPVLSQTQLDALASTAGVALGEETRSGYLPIAVTAETRDATEGIGRAGSPLTLAAGLEIELAARCMGQGSVTVHWQAPGGVTGVLPVICSEHGPTARVRFTPSADGHLILCTLRPDDEAVGRAGLAITLVEQ
jgi:hypothetical protein